MTLSDLKRTGNAHDVELAKIAWTIADALTQQYGMTIVEGFSALLGIPIYARMTTRETQWLANMETVEKATCGVDIDSVIAYLIPSKEYCESIYKRV